MLKNAGKNADQDNSENEHFLRIVNVAECYVLHNSLSIFKFDRSEVSENLLFPVFVSSFLRDFYQ